MPPYQPTPPKRKTNNSAPPDENLRDGLNTISDKLLAVHSILDGADKLRKEQIEIVDSLCREIFVVVESLRAPGAS